MFEGWTADLAVLSALLLATAVGGRPFAKLSVGGTRLFVTEVAIVATAALLVRRVGFAGVLERVRRDIPLAALLPFWLAGAIAAARGLHGYDVSSVLHDIGLVEYSIFVPIVAAVADTRDRVLRLVRTIGTAGAVATVVYLFVYNFDAGSTIGPVKNPSSAVGFYLSLAALPVIAALAQRRIPASHALVLAVAALALISYANTRSLVVALVLAAATVVVLARRGERRAAATAAVGAVIVSMAGGWLLERAHSHGRVVVAALLLLLLSPIAVEVGRRNRRLAIALAMAVIVAAGAAWAATRGRPAAPPPPAPASVVVVNPNFVANDAGRWTVGGRSVVGGALRSHWARELKLGEPYMIQQVTGLRPGGVYTVVLWARPLEPRITSIAVGDTAGTGWAIEHLTAAPVTRWQRLQVLLRATRASEHLMIVPDGGSRRVLLDGLKIVHGRLAGPSGDFAIQTPVVRTAFVADDAATAFEGGSVVTGGAAQGRFARQVANKEALIVRRLEGLRRGRAYRVTFAVEPTRAVPTVGNVGNLGGTGWGIRWWSVRGEKRWQHVAVTLRARLSSDQLGIIAYSGAPAIRVDDIRVVPVGSRVTAAPASNSFPTSPRSVPGEPTTGGRGVGVEGPSTVIGSFSDSLSSVSGDGVNARWRLAYWWYTIRRAASEPLFGIGFGRPAGFHWHGVVYDARTGNPADPFDITPPHNSYLNVLLRTGLLGLLPMLALMGVACVRTIRAVRAGMPADDRLVVVATSGAFVFAAGVAMLNVMLEGPYVAMFFWTLLALLLVLPRRLDGGASTLVNGRLRS